MSQLKVNSIIPVSGVPTGGGGGIIQTIQTVKTDIFQSTSTSYADVTGLTVNITPTSTSSKILVSCLINGTGNTSTQGYFALARVISSSTDNTIFVGDADGSRIRASIEMYENQSNECKNGTIIFLDSPNTTSQITYKIQCVTQGTGTIVIGRSTTDVSGASSGRFPCSIIAQEVSA